MESSIRVVVVWEEARIEDFSLQALGYLCGEDASKLPESCPTQLNASIDLFVEITPGKLYGMSEVYRCTHSITLNKMSMKTVVTVCRICLAMDVPTFNIADSPLQNIYEKLTSISLNTIHQPLVVCYICCAQLRKSHDLMVRSLRANRALAQILLSDDLVPDELISMLNQQAYQHALLITPISNINITGSEYNLIKTEIEEPLLCQYNEKMETETPASADCLTFEKSEDERDMQGELLEDVDIDSRGLMTNVGDIKQEESDPLNVSNPIEDDTGEMVNGMDIKSEGTEDMTRTRATGAAPSETCKQTHVEKIQDGSTLTPGGKNILKKPRTFNTVLEEATSRNIGRNVLRGTKTENNRQVSTNSYSDTATYKSNTSTGGDDEDCGDVLDENHLLIERVVAVKKTSHPKSPQQRTISRKQRLNRTGVVDKETDTHGGKKLFECEICKVRFTRKEHLKTHLRIHTGEKPYECEICKGRFNEKGTLNKHLRIHTGEKNYECEICKGRFNQKGSLNKHLRIHTGEKPYECKICKGRFSEKGGLNKHLRVHTGEKPYECEVCKGRFTSNSTLKIHLRIHTGEKPYECEICKGRYREKGHFKKHLRTHTGEKPYECEICKNRFTVKSNLDKHLLIHTGEKPHECEICKFRCSLKNNLRKHLRIHTDEKPYECDICKIRFRHNSSLRIHLRSHTYKKPYECQICKARFRANVNLKIHLSKHSGEKP